MMFNPDYRPMIVDIVMGIDYIDSSLLQHTRYDRLATELGIGFTSRDMEERILTSILNPAKMIPGDEDGLLTLTRDSVVFMHGQFTYNYRGIAVAKRLCEKVDSRFIVTYDENDHKRLIPLVGNEAFLVEIDPTRQVNYLEISKMPPMAVAEGLVREYFFKLSRLGGR